MKKKKTELQPATRDNQVWLGDQARNLTGVETEKGMRVCGRWHVAGRRGQVLQMKVSTSVGESRQMKGGRK